MKHNASIIGEYTGILLLNQCCWKGIFNFEWLFWHTAKWHIARCYIEASLCSNTMTNKTIRASCNYKKCSMYTNVLIKIIKFVVELWHNWNYYGHNIEHNGWLFWALLESIIGKNLSIISRGLDVLFQAHQQHKFLLVKLQYTGGKKG